MLRRNHGQASGINCASGTLDEIIPPSIVLGLVGDLYLGSLIPGFSLAAMYII